MKKSVLLAVAFLMTLGASAQINCEGKKDCCEKSNRPTVFRIDDMHCQKCANRIKARLAQKIEGVDTVIPNFKEHSLEIRFDAARTNAADIRTAITKAGYTPVNYCQCGKGAYGYFLIPKEATTQETIDKVRGIKGVMDANTTTVRRSLAVVYNTKELSEEQLLEAIRQQGIDAALPKPHVCSEDKK